MDSCGTCRNGLENIRKQMSPNGTHNYLSSNRRYRRVYCRFKRVQLEAMVLAVVVTRVSHSSSRSDTCVMLEGAEVNRKEQM